ncbi:MAG: SDR family oxidoreductase [Homoserinimonas sp.]
MTDASPVALVTGGSRGIGAAIAEELAAGGIRVVISYRSDARAAESVVERARVAGGRVVAICSDLAAPDAPEALVAAARETFGRLDIVVNNAGIFPTGALETLDATTIDQAIALHVRAPLLVARAASPHLPDGGRIINIGTCFLERTPYAGLALYTATKASLLGLTRALARDLGPRGIAVSLVNPGNTDTDANPATGPDAEIELPYMAIPAYAKPRDIALTVAHLCGPAGRFITGGAISVDAGYAA